MDHIYGYLWLRRVQVRESRGTMQSGHFLRVDWTFFWTANEMHGTFVT